MRMTSNDTSRPSVRERQKLSVCVTFNSLSRGTRSATTPPIGGSTIMGMARAKPTKPR